MEIALNRIDYSLVGPNSIQTMKLLPNADERGQQKIAIGSHDGVVQIFNIKKGNLVHAFKSLPGRKITRLELGGVHDHIQDKVFVAADNEVRGYNKKGKLFLCLETTLTEPIQHISIRGNDLMVASLHTLLHYADCVERANLTFCDKITDIKVLATPSLKTVIACEDRTLRLLQHQQQTVIAEVVGRPTCLQLAPSGPDDVLYGAHDGTIGLVSFAAQPVVKWVLESGGGINCMCLSDVTGDGDKELIIGKQDGCVEIFSFDQMQQLPLKKATYSCMESIMSVQAGLVGSSEHVEIIAVTYSGWFFGLTTENKESLELRHGDGPTNMSAEMQERLNLLRMEIDEIEQKVVKEREKYKQVTQTKPDALTLVPNIEINDKFWLMASEAVYMLSIEVQTPIDNVLIQSNAPLQILDVERNSAVVSHSLCNPQDGNELLVTYRCQVNTSRLEVMVQTSEGTSGELRAYVTVSMLPKCCRSIIYHIKPLSLHQRTHDLALDRPYNTLSLVGAFSLAEVHSWLMLCLPEVPEKAPLTVEGVLTYKNTFLNTILHCVYTKGKAEFKSDNMSTISTIKDVLTKAATSKKIELDISCDIHPGSTSHILEMLHPLLENQKKISSEFRQLEALHELRQAGVALPEKYQQILDRELQLKTSMSKQPQHIKRLITLICNLFVDIGNFKGGGARGRVSQLSELLENYKDVQNLIEFFERP